MHTGTECLVHVEVIGAVRYVWLDFLVVVHFVTGQTMKRGWERGHCDRNPSICFELPQKRRAGRKSGSPGSANQGEGMISAMTLPAPPAVRQPTYCEGSGVLWKTPWRLCKPDRGSGGPWAQAHLAAQERTPEQPSQGPAWPNRSSLSFSIGPGAHVAGCSHHAADL